MKKYIVLSLCCLFSVFAFSQVKNDSLAYQQQRRKINAMLAQRSQKFGQYTESLNMHTGIFGLQTKKDIRRSNDILMDIVKTDDAIYRELKILLEYRTFQQSQVQSHSNQGDENQLGYMTTINKLRQQNDQLKADMVKLQQHQEKFPLLYIVVFLLILAAISALIALKKKRNV